MQVKKGDIERVFEKFELEVRSTKHLYGRFWYDGKKILRVHFSHGRGDLPGRVADKIRSQLKLSESDFVAQINCSLSLAGSIAILKKKGLLESGE
jgi:hypothetical protein